MYCVTCGAANPDSAERCVACGRKLVGTDRMTPVDDSERAERVPSYLAPAIASTLCCGCLPFGIVAIVYSTQVDGKLALGDIDGAKRASASAKMWCWISLGMGLVVGLPFLVGIIQQLANLR
jgi:Interferon-induced transmembrane protein